MNATEMTVNDSGAMHLTGGTVTDGRVLTVASGGLDFVYFRQVDQSSEGLSYTEKSTTELSLPYTSWGIDGLGVPVVTPIDATLDKVAVPVVTTAENQRFVRMVVDW